MEYYYVEMKIKKLRKQGKLEAYEKIWGIDYWEDEAIIVVKIKSHHPYQIISENKRDYSSWVQKLDPDASLEYVKILDEPERHLNADLLAMTESNFIELCKLPWRSERYLVQVKSLTEEIRKYVGVNKPMHSFNNHLELTHPEFEKLSTYVTQKGWQLQQKNSSRGTVLNVAEYETLSLQNGYLLEEEIVNILQTQRQSNLIVSDTGTGKTYASVRAANVYAKKSDGVVIVAYPTTSLTMQQGEQVFCSETIKSIEDRIVLQTEIMNREDKVFHCTYDYALKLIESLRDSYKINLIVDEAHNMSSALDYRRKVIGELIQMAKQVHKVLYLTATPTMMPLEYFDGLYRSDITSSNISHRETVFLGLEREKAKQIEDIIDLINYTLNYRRKRLLLFYNYKEDLRTIQNIIEKDLKAKAVVITPNTKSSPQYIDLVEKGCLSHENKVDVVLTTQFMAEGINLYLNQEFDVAAVISSESNLYSPEIIKQASHRIRDGYDRFYIMIEENHTVIKDTNFQMLYHSEYTRAIKNLKDMKFYNQVRNSNLDGVDIRRGVTVENLEKLNIHNINCFSIAHNVANEMNEVYKNKTDLMIDLISLYMRGKEDNLHRPLLPFSIGVLNRENLIDGFPFYAQSKETISKSSGANNRYKEIKENPEEYSDFEQNLKILLQNQESEIVKEKFISNYGEKLYDKMMDFATLEVLTVESILKIMDLDPAQQNLERFGKSVVLAIVQVAMDYQILKPDDMKLVKLLSYMENNWKTHLGQTEFVRNYLNKDLPITQTSSDVMVKTEEEELFNYYKGSYSWHTKSGKYLYVAKKFEHIADKYLIDIEVIQKVAIKMMEKNYNLKHIQFQPSVQKEILNKLKAIFEQSSITVESNNGLNKSRDYSEVIGPPEPMDYIESILRPEPKEFKELLAPLEAMGHLEPIDYPEPTPPPKSIDYL